MPAYKIGSGDISNIKLIEKIAKLEKPILLATGASTFEDVKRAVSIINNRVPVVLMQCNTNYENNPSHRSFQNISVISTFKKEFPNVQLGLSCHHPGHLTVLAAISLGGLVIEKHFTDNNKLPGPDHSFAMDPRAFKLMTVKIKTMEMIMGNEKKEVYEEEKDQYVSMKRGIKSAKSLKKGQLLKRKFLKILRPCLPDDIPADDLKSVIGKKLKVNLEANKAIKKRMILTKSKVKFLN